MTVAIIGPYSSSALEASQISDSGHFTTAHLPVHAKSPHRPIVYGYTIGWQMLEAVTSCEGRRGLAPMAASEQSKEKKTGVCIGSTSETTWTSVADVSQEPTQAPLVQDSMHLGQASWFRKRRKHALKGSSSSTPHLYPTSYQGNSCQHTTRKDMTCIPVKSRSPTTGIEHTQSV